jgi:hypothetical protein
MSAYITGSEAMLFEVGGSTPTTNGSNTGTLTSSGGTVNINASSNFNANICSGTSTGAITIGNTLAGAVSIQSASASIFKVTGANLTIGTLTSGATAIVSAGALNLTNAAASTWTMTGPMTLSGGLFITSTAASVAYGATMALVVASNKITVAGVNGTSATATINCAAVAPAGAPLIIETTADASGTVTVTFGTHFRTTGTQATTASKISEIFFVGDGTNWNEVCRNTSMT